MEILNNQFTFKQQQTVFKRSHSAERKRLPGKAFENTNIHKHLLWSLLRNNLSRHINIDENGQLNYRSEFSLSVIY